jgi:glutamate formiminotransferase/formiminotetrahydrofolate cyclodeaminase
MSMPKGTDDEKKARGAAMQDAVKQAMQVPLDAAILCWKVIQYLRELVDIANPNLISDVGVAAILAEAALRGAGLNVQINLAYLKDKDLATQTRAKLEHAASCAAAVLPEIMQKVERAIGGQ